MTLAEELIALGVAPQLARYVTARYEFPQDAEDLSPENRRAYYRDLASKFAPIGFGVAGDYPELYLPPKASVRVGYPEGAQGITRRNKYLPQITPEITILPNQDIGHPAHIMAHELGHAAGIGWEDTPRSEKLLQMASSGFVPLGTPIGHSGLGGELMADLYARDVLQPRDRRVWDDPQYEMLFRDPQTRLDYLRETFSHTPHMREAPPAGVLDTIRQYLAAAGISFQ